MTELIINHLLFFVANKYTTTPRDKIVENVVKFYVNFDEINDAKKLLYNKLNKNFTSRRGDDKALKTAQDIVETYVLCDNNGVNLPTFVATDYGKIPITTDGSVTMEQVLNLIHVMSSRLGDVEKSLSGRVQSGVVNGAAAVGGVGVGSMMTASTSAPSATSTATLSSASITAPTTTPVTAASTSSIMSTFVSPAALAAPSANDTAAAAAAVTAATTAAAAAANSDPWLNPRERGRGPGRRKNGMDHRQTTRSASTRSRSRQTFIGTKVTSGEISWGGVDLLVHRYIGKVRNDVTTIMIEEDLKARGVEIINLEENVEKKHARYKSFKLTVKQTAKALISQKGFWPSGVLVRPWFDPRQRRDDTDGAGVPTLAS